MTLPIFIDRPLRRFMKHFSKKSFKQVRVLLLLVLPPLLLLIHRYTSGHAISLTHAYPTTRPGITVITPCKPHSCNTPLTDAQILNLHATLANTDFLHIHTDCNESTHGLPPSTGRFYTTATSILLPRDAFLRAGGFDERLPAPVLTTLINRLSTIKTLYHASLSPQTAASTVYTHLPLSKWTPEQSSLYKSSKTHLTLHSSPPVQNFTALPQARRRALHDVHHLPWILLNRLNDTSLHSMITMLDSGRRVVLIHVAHGLGNRLRAVGSSLAFAKSTNRVPVLIWPTDAHCTVRFGQLFEDPIFEVITDLPGYPFKDASFYDYTWSKWDLYNYMPGEGGIKDELIANSGKHIYYKGAYVMRTPLTSWDAANEHIRALIPVKSIAKKVEGVTERLKRSIGVHIRHLTTKDDIGGVDPVAEYGDFDTRVIGYFRSICSPRVFIAELRKVTKETGLKEVFVASDSPQWRNEIAEEIDGVWGLNKCEGRCEIEALVDLLALARCPTVLGSFWSSFSEAVQRFSGRKIRLAGVDFGEAAEDFGKDVEQYVTAIVEKRRAAGN